MADAEKAFERMTAVPWKALLAALGLAFVASTVASTVVGHLFITRDTQSQRSAPLPQETFHVPPPTPSLNQSAIDSILKRNLFNSEGQALDQKKPDQAKEQQQAEAVKSDLRVKLLGTIYGGDPFSGIALVENDEKKTINSFMCGDSLLKDTIVKEIHQEKIIIDRSGRLEYIEVQREALSRGRRGRKKAVPVVSEPTVAPLATDPPPATFREEGFERKDKDIVMSQAYRQKLLTGDFTKVLQDAKATPNVGPDGQINGFILTRIRKDSIYEKAGMQNDDVITEINGVPLSDASQAIKHLNSLRNESEIEVRGTRGGSPIKFNLSVK